VVCYLPYDLQFGADGVPVVGIIQFGVRLNSRGGFLLLCVVLLSFVLSNDQEKPELAG
jgi:hypothetical protein